MVIAYPWSGRDWNRTIAISGRAAMPGIPNGSGFNWRSVAGTTGMMRPRGLGRIRRGGRGLGQDTSLIPTGVDTSALFPTGSDPITTYNTSSAQGGSTLDLSYVANLFGNPTGGAASSTAATTATTTSSGTPWYAGLLSSIVGVGSQISNYELNPLTNKQTYIQTPQGGIIATNNPNVTGTGIPGLTSTTASSLLPLLLLGGGVVVLMMMAKR